MVAVLLLLFSWAIVDLTPGRAARQAFDQAALRITAPLNPDTPKVKIVNLNGFPKPTQVPCGRRNGSVHYVRPLDRARLLAWIEAIASNASARPYSIGVDADFGSCDGYYVVPKRDPGFFEELMQFERITFAVQRGKANVGPIYLGVLRGDALPPTEWLVDPSYAGLAANIGIPEDPERSVQAIWPAGSARAGLGIAEVLAFPYGRSRKTVDSLAWIRQDVTSFSEEGARIDVFPVDFHALPIIRATITPLGDPTLPAAIQSLKTRAADGEFGDDIVLLGIVDEVDGKVVDGHSVPGYGMQPGVLVHATAANSLRSSRLYELRAEWRIALDIICSVFVLIAIAVVRFYHLKKARLRKDQLAKIFSAVLGFAIFCAALLLVALARVVWDEALILAIVVAIHPYFEKWGLRMVQILPARFRATWTSAAYENPGSKQ